MATFNFFLLPADQCATAIDLYKLAQADALSATQSLLEKYGADAIMRAGSHVDALAWRDRPIAMTGFTIPRFDAKQGVWVQKPKQNTIRGKKAAAEMKDAGEMLEIWQWALEKALGVYGSVLGYCRGTRVFMNSVAHPLDDGRVVLSIPVRGSRDTGMSSVADPVAPYFAVEISKAEAEQLVGKPIGELI